MRLKKSQKDKFVLYMSNSTTRITDLPENTIQMPGGSNMENPIGRFNPPQNSFIAPKQPISLEATTTRLSKTGEFDTNYIPINIHPNPYGNNLQPDIDNTHIRLPSRDIPSNTIHFQQDEEVLPNYIPKAKMAEDYVKRQENNYNNNIGSHEQKIKRKNDLDNLFTEYQFVVLLCLLFFLFQLPIVQSLMYKYLFYLPIFCSDGNINLFGITIKSILFGLCFIFIQKSIDFLL